MAHKITNDELSSYLEATSKADLIAWLMERCEEDEKLRASLLDLVTPRENTEALVSEIRDRIHQAWQLAEHRDGWKMALPISRELNQVLDSIQSLIEKDCPREAEALLVEFLTTAERSADQVDGLTCPTDGGRGASLLHWAAIDTKGILYGRQKHTTETVHRGVQAA
ncbi:MAG: hypothetical protein M1274_11045, partial [Actinobacteria bacterium]|nr:hypothetical protein [Actinomycetota bacterium]